MLVSGDYDLSLSLRYEEPVKEALKDTILRQEYTFKKQVYELHRLYDTQKTMMKDLSWKELDGVYFSREGRQANPVAFENCIRPSSMPAEKRICSVPKVFNWLQEQRGNFPGFQQQLSNPQICSPHYLDHIAGKNLAKRHGLCSSRENSIERNHYYYGGVVHCPEEVNLSLTIGRNYLKTSARTKTFNHIIDLEESDETLPDTKTDGRSKTWKNVIDLEESDFTVSNGELKTKSPLKSVAHVSYSGYKRDYQSIHSLNNSIRNNWFDRTPRNYFVSNGSTSHVEQNSFAEGVEQCEEPLLSKDISAKRKIVFSDEGAFLDLNKSISDDSFHSDDPSFSSNRASSRESRGLAGEPCGCTFPAASNWREQNDNSSNKTSAFVHQRILNSATGSSSSGYKSMENGGVDQSSINLNQPLSQNSGSPCSLVKNFDYKKSELTVEFQDRDDQAPSTPETKVKKAKQDAMSSPDSKTQDIVKDIGSDRSPSSSKSCLEDISSGIETMQSGAQLGNSSSSNCNAFSDSEILEANKSPHQEDVDSSSNSDDQKGKTSEVDGLIIRGAVSLVYLGLECSELINVNSMDKIEGDNVELPQSSLDSFEEMVLKQPESSVDNYSVTSSAFEVNDTEGKVNGITLKRGRRMKDFQRDIMPSLATLSRQEIFEDVKIMETALRSREYKRLRSKTTSGHKWFNHVRNRRSRLNYVRRKHYS